MQRLSTSLKFPSPYPSSISPNPVLPLPSRYNDDKYLWELLHRCDYHDSDTAKIEQEGTAFMRSTENSAEDVTVGSPDWAFLCGDWNKDIDSLLVVRDSHLVAALQKEAHQLKLTTYTLLSARLIEVLFELGIDARIEDGIGDIFWKRAETVSWRHGLGTLGYSLELYQCDPGKSPQQADRMRNDALQHACSARQLRVLYKYG